MYFKEILLTNIFLFFHIACSLGDENIETPGGQPSGGYVYGVTTLVAHFIGAILANNIYPILPILVQYCKVDAISFWANIEL